MQQAKDFYDESECLKELVSSLRDKELKAETLFKSWTIEDGIKVLSQHSRRDPSGSCIHPFVWKVHIN